MARNAWKLVALSLLAAGAIATAAPTADTGVAGKALEPRPTAPENVCDDREIGETFGGDPNGCREYLDACLGELTSRQRAEWARSVDDCLSGSTPFYRCYARVPWC